MQETLTEIIEGLTALISKVDEATGEHLDGPEDRLAALFAAEKVLADARQLIRNLGGVR